MERLSIGWSMSATSNTGNDVAGKITTLIPSSALSSTGRERHEDNGECCQGTRRLRRNRR